MDVRYRAAASLDAGVLAPMNAQLIRDEGHRNSMTMPQLTARMSEWLKTEYQAFLFELEGKTIGYALYRIEPEYIYLRQLFVQPEMRRRGIARRALEWLCHNAWGARSRVRIDVLVGNHSGIEFWRSVGFTDYCLAMERLV
jgi:GNAT superfamily N-acetyltransferase